MGTVGGVAGAKSFTIASGRQGTDVDLAQIVLKTGHFALFSGTILTNQGTNQNILESTDTSYFSRACYVHLVRSGSGWLHRRHSPSLNRVREFEAQAVASSRRALLECIKCLKFPSLTTMGVRRCTNLAVSLRGILSQCIVTRTD